MSGVAINNARFVQIVGGHLDIHLVTDGDADEVFSHFARDMGQDFMPVGKCNPEHCPRQDLSHIPSQFYWLFFRHKR